MPSEVEKVYETVKHILEISETARECDHHLYAIYATKQIGRFNLQIFLNYKHYGLKSFEAISRARRRVQAAHPELLDKETAQKRAEYEQDYFLFYGKEINT